MIAGDPRPPRRPAALRAVLFDMDGLLVDSEPLWFEVERAVMARLGGRWGEADQRGADRRLAGPHRVVAAGQGGRGRRPAGREDVARWLVADMARADPGPRAAAAAGRRPLLAGLDAAGVPCALVTASSRAIMEAVLKVTGLSFSVTVCGEDVRRGKPDPEPYLLAAARLGVPAAGCVVLEDSPTGIAAARAAGCPVIAVPSVPVPPGPGLLTVESLEEVGI